MTNREWQSQAEQLGEIEPLSSTEIDRVRRVICANAQGDTLVDQLADAELLMSALGVHPQQKGELDYRLEPGAPLNRTFA